jgi:hypothetical protein
LKNVLFLGDFLPERSNFGVREIAVPKQQVQLMDSQGN